MDYTAPTTTAASTSARPRLSEFRPDVANLNFVHSSIVNYFQKIISNRQLNNINYYIVEIVNKYRYA